jgi:hypothetical protein
MDFVVTKLVTVGTVSTHSGKGRQGPIEAAAALAGKDFENSITDSDAVQSYEFELMNTEFSITLTKSDTNPPANPDAWDDPRGE